MESFNIDHLEITPVQEQNQILPTLECCDFFNINFCYTHVAKTFGKPTVTSSNQSFYVPCDLLCEFGEFPMIHDLLPSMDIPPELLDAVLPQLVSTARDMLAANSQRCRRGMLTLVVKLAVTSTPSTDASSFVDSLEKLRVDDASCCEAKRCSICLNKFCHAHDDDDEDEGIGISEVVRTPCSHVYHKACILRWINTSSSCPMCRHQLPS